jgi:hypothetical protein
MTVRSAILGFLISITVLALPIQALIDPSTKNVAAACIVMASSLAVLLYLLCTTALESYPLSTFALFGFCVTSQFGALIVQTTAWTAISRSLYDPLYTFGALAFYQAIALATHIAYRFFSVKRASSVQVFRGFFGWLGIYRVPSSGTLWFMGCVGLSTFFLSHYEGIAGKVAAGFSFLTWAPFLILFYLRDIGESYCDAKLNKLLLTAYAGAAVAFGLALNTRAVMFQGVATIGLLYLLTGMRNSSPVTTRSVLKLGALALVLAAAAGPVSDLATSMAIARQWRGKVSGSEMIKTTFHVLTKPNLIAAYRARGEDAARFSAYDEHYVVNPLLNRLVSTKYYDNSFHFASTLTTGDAKARLRAASIEFAWGALPSPVLVELGIPVAKEDLTYSMGDYLAYLSRGVPLGGHKIGSMFAQGIVLFGPLFPFLYAGICLTLFGLMDLLTLRPAVGKASLAALGMLQIWNFFAAGISYEALHLVLYWLFRNFAQMVLIYVFVFGVARSLTSKKHRSAGAPTVPTWQRG